MICIFRFALFYFTWSYDTGLLRRHLLAMICSTCTVTCWGGKPVFAVGLDTLLMEKNNCRHRERSCVGPVFIYKYLYFCVLACTLCRN